MQSFAALYHFSRTIVAIAAIAGLYFAFGKIGLLITAPPSYSTIIWMPSGLSLAALIVFGYRVAPGIFLGSFLTNLSHAGGLSLEQGIVFDHALVPAMIASGSTLQAIVAARLIFKFYGNPINLSTWRDVFILVAILAPSSCVIAAIIGVTSLYYGGVIHEGRIITDGLTWWAGDYLGVLIVAPAIVLIPLFSQKVMWKGEKIQPLPLLSIFALLVPLGITFYAWVAVSEFQYERNVNSFQQQAIEGEKALIHRIDSYELALQGARSFFLHSRVVTKHEWHEYVHSLDVEKNFVGIYGIGWINKVLSQDLSDYQAWARTKSSEDFTIHPPTPVEQSEHYVITYIEPEERSKSAVGLDISFEKKRRDAAAISIDSGIATITKTIELVQDKERGPGFLLLLPMYKSGLPLQTVEQRRKAVTGWIYAPFIARQFLKDLTAGQGKYMHIRVYDGDKVDDSALIYDSNKFRKTASTPHYSVTKVIGIKQNHWTVVWDSTPIFEAQIKSYEPILILMSGAFITLIFATFLYSLSRRTFIIQKEVEAKTEELRYQKQQLQMIFDNVPARIWYKDDKNNILRLNRQAAISMGGEVADFEGKNTKDFFPELADAYLLDDLQALDSGQPKLGIIEEFKPTDGMVGWIRTDKVPFLDVLTGQKTLLVVSQDITDQKLAEDKLRFSEERYDLAVRGMSVGLWDWDNTTGDVFWSNQFKGILGIKNLSFQATIDDFKVRVHPDDLDKVMESIHRHFIERASHDMEFRMRHEEGHYIWVRGSGQAIWDESGIPLRMAGSIADISARKYAEEALIRSEELNNLAVRGMSVGLWDWNIKTSEITTSYKLHEVLGWNYGSEFVSNFNDFVARVHPDDIERVSVSINNHLIFRQPYDVEYRLQGEDGTFIWLQACGQAKWDEDGNATRMVGSIANIDARKRAEEKLIQSNAELERFAYVASHDLQEPLRMVRNFTQILMEEYGEKFDENAKGYMKFVVEGAARMQDLISDLLEYSRVDKEDSLIQSVDCMAILQDVEVNLKQALQESKGHIYYENLPVINANAVQMTRLLQNLIGNAIKYRHKDIAPDILISVTSQEENWIFSVADNGIGIREEYLDQIFVLFKRLHRSSEYQGTGIGLAICKKIVEAMGGEIWVESEFGQGSTFFFTVPKK